MLLEFCFLFLCTVCRYWCGQVTRLFEKVATCQCTLPRGRVSLMRGGRPHGGPGMRGTKCEELANSRELRNIYRANLANGLKYYPKTESSNREIEFAFKCNSGCYAPIPDAGSLPLFSCGNEASKCVQQDKIQGSRYIRQVPCYVWLNYAPSWLLQNTWGK